MVQFFVSLALADDSDFACFFFLSLTGVQRTIKLLTDPSVGIHDETRVCEPQILHQQGKLSKA